ncbi:helix-turn-helix domain-containing protein [Streptomyces sp. NPDC058457]|uniref:helix-turn-helix domain-containing protein n=1 Tax=Streptomyces sp. NPDC058457 TaxID=3346507 RepID=UPI003656AC1C
MDGGQPVSGFGELLRSQRERAGMTQQCLADHATLSVRAVRDMEAGRVRRPRHETVRLVADALRLTGRARSAFEASARRQVPAEEPTAPPAPRTAIVGRERETATLARCLTGDGDRLVSVVGLGGVGKTRLALEAAWHTHRSERWPVHWVSCGDRLSLAAPAGRTGPLEAVGDRPALLVLDGADDGLDHTLLDRVFHRHPSLRVLVTTRSPLSLDGEQVVPLAPLDTPGPDTAPSDLAAVPAVRLMLAHMRRLRPGLTLEPSDTLAIAGLCAYLDGLPRALEYAAGWTLLESPGRLTERLSAAPFGLAAPPVTHCERGDVRDALDEALRSLTADQLAFVRLLSDSASDWSLEEAAAADGRSAQHCHQSLHELLSRGLLRLTPDRNSARFAVLNLVRTVCREQYGTPGLAPMPGEPLPRTPFPAALVS